MLKSIITNPEIKIVKGIHPDFRVRANYGYQKDTWTYHYGKTAVRLASQKREGIRFIEKHNCSELYEKIEYTLYCLEGNMFSGVKSFDSKKKAEAWLEPNMIDYEDNRMCRTR